MSIREPGFYWVKVTKTLRAGESAERWVVAEFGRGAHRRCWTLPGVDEWWEERDVEDWTIGPRLTPPEE